MIFIKAGHIGLEIGGNPITSALFYSIAHHLERRDWGSKYPVIMKELYYDGIEIEHLEQGLKEIKEIKNEFKKLNAKEMIMLYEDAIKVAPWEFEFTEDMENLYESIRSPEGYNIIDTIILAIETGIKQKVRVYLEGGVLVHKMDKINIE